MGLSELREKIDSLDIELQRLFEERMAICDEVAREKKRTNAPVLQGNREQQIIDAVRGRSSEGFEQSSVDFINSIMAISRGRQNFHKTREGLPTVISVIICCLPSL